MTRYVARKTLRGSLGAFIELDQVFYILGHHINIVSHLLGVLTCTLSPNTPMVLTKWLVG